MAKFSIGDKVQVGGVVATVRDVSGQVARPQSGPLAFDKIVFWVTAPEQPQPPYLANFQWEDMYKVELESGQTVYAPESSLTQTQ